MSPRKKFEADAVTKRKWGWKNMKVGKRVLAALALMAVAMTVIAYANSFVGTITVTTQEVVTVSSTSFTFPARSTGTRTASGVITLDFTKGGFIAGDKVRVGVELVIDNPEVFEGFRSLVVQIIDSSTGDVVAMLTKDTPYAEFVVTVPNPLAAETYDVKIIYATGGKTISATFKLSVTILGLE